MRALVSTDLHSSPEAARVIKGALEQDRYDVHICLGDIVTFRPIEYLEDLFGRPPVPTVAVPGNTDSVEARARLGDLGIDIHFRSATVKGVTIVGAGGCTPPPFRTAFVVEEHDYARNLPPLMEGADILASHAPARGWLDRVMPGVHVGGRALREVVEAARPPVVLSGHIHQADGIVLWDWDAGEAAAEEGGSMEADLRGRTLFMNPGPAKDGRLGEVVVRGRKVQAKILRR